MHLPAFLLERYFATHEFTAPFVLCSSDCESMTIADLLAFEPNARELLERCTLGYIDTKGQLDLRCHIAELYDRIDSNQVMVHAGAQEAIFAFMVSHLRRGDHVIAQAPTYQSLFSVAQSLGCRLSFWKADETSGWALQLTELRKLIERDTRLIVVNMPCNPTGYVMALADWVDLLHQAERDSILVFSDEVYRFLEHESNDRLPAACDISSSAVSLGVLSKSFGLAGLRIGWLATRNDRALAAVARAKDYLSICNSAPSELLAMIALRNRAKILAKNLSLVRQNLALLGDFFTKHADSFSWQQPSAGPIAFPRYKKGTTDDFCQTLLASHGVLLLPSSIYKYGMQHFRIGFGRRNMPEALARLEQFVCTL